MEINMLFGCKLWDKWILQEIDMASWYIMVDTRVEQIESKTVEAEEEKWCGQ